jgi:hypothetical protein
MILLLTVDDESTRVTDHVTIEVQQLKKKRCRPTPCVSETPSATSMRAPFLGTSFSFALSDCMLIRSGLSIYR